MSDLTHLDEQGRARMVDVSAKPDTAREATAEARVRITKTIAAAIRDGTTAKGDALRTAELAGVMGGKKTAELVPLCHPLPLDQLTVTACLDGVTVVFVATARTSAKTGVEMEAMTAASIAALTLYDMVKSLDKGVEIETVRLIEKKGGKSGHWRRDAR